MMDDFIEGLGVTILIGFFATVLFVISLCLGALFGVTFFIPLTIIITTLIAGGLLNVFYKKHSRW